jgi:vacuolar-type H+-ATPase subunit H
MSDERGEPLNHQPAEWTVGTLAIYSEALRKAEEKFQGERDRRYGEVKEAEEKALKIKERADEVALGLQRETQQYKDEKANELREQIASERNLYVTKDQLGSAIREIAATRQQFNTSLIGWIGLALLAGGIITKLLS